MTQPQEQTMDATLSRMMETAATVARTAQLPERATADLAVRILGELMLVRKNCEAAANAEVERLTQQHENLQFAYDYRSKILDGYEGEISDMHLENEKLRAEVAEWRLRHADCTTSLITADRKIERLQKEMAELRRQQWQPIMNGSWGDIYIENDGQSISIYVDEEYGYAAEDLPNNIRLCRLAAQEQEGEE